MAGESGAGEAVRAKEVLWQRQQQPPPVVVLIVSNDDRLRPFGPEIEYNGRDAFEFGAVGCVVAPMDATIVPEDAQRDASFTFKHLEVGG